MQEGMQNVDIIFCRNVTIYLDCQTTRRIIENFYNCLAQEGYLFLGHTETLWQITNKFERVEFPQTFIYKKRLSPVQEDAVKPFMPLPETNIEDITPVKEIGTENILNTFLLQEIRPGIKEKPEPLGQTHGFSANPMTAQDRNHILTCLSDATVLANEAKYKEAGDILAKVIEADNLSVEAYYLLGVLFYKSGALKEAETQFRKVIYVDPDSVLAYFNLGNIYLYQRKFREAAREFRNAIRLSERRPKDEQVRFCEDFTVEFLLRACRNNLLEISKRGERYE